MEELIRKMQQEVESYILVDKQSGVQYDLIEATIVEDLLKKYITKAWNHDIEN